MGRCSSRLCKRDRWPLLCKEWLHTKTTGSTVALIKTPSCLSAGLPRLQCHLALLLLRQPVVLSSLSHWAELPAAAAAGCYVGHAGRERLANFLSLICRVSRRRYSLSAVSLSHSPFFPLVFFFLLVLLPSPSLSTALSRSFPHKTARLTLQWQHTNPSDSPSLYQTTETGSPVCLLQAAHSCLPPTDGGYTRTLATPPPPPPLASCCVCLVWASSSSLPPLPQPTASSQPPASQPA